MYNSVPDYVLGAASVSVSGLCLYLCVCVVRSIKGPELLNQYVGASERAVRQV